MEKMVLVPVEAIYAIIGEEMGLEHPDFTALRDAITNAPIAAIPLKEAPEDCSLCPCQCVGICSVTMTEANYKKRPANCPIVEKE
ncbi:MAG: hypothetical protein WC374_04660 [Phycisphaerae bacterium]